MFTYLGGFTVRRPWLVCGCWLVLGAALSLGLFMLLERNLWLSRFMGLRIDASSAGWKSALLFWLLGVVILLFRSTTAQHQLKRSPTALVKEKAPPIVYVFNREGKWTKFTGEKIYDKVEALVQELLRSK